MAITYKAALEVASHEGIVREAYKDSVGVWTWSIGITGATGHDVKRYIGHPQTMEHCLRIYVWALQKYAREVEQAFEGFLLTEPQFAATLSFHYNTGAINRASWVKKWKAGDVAGARKAIMAWNKPPEIKNRRMKERDLFFDGKWSNNGTTTEYRKVSSSGNLVWSSAKRVNISADLRAAMTEKVQQPDDPGPVHATIKEDGVRRNGIFGAVAVLLTALAAWLQSQGWFSWLF